MCDTSFVIGIELIGGVEHRTIEIIAYDAGWPDKFRAEYERISAALGDRAERIDHIGSTSVPGLPAKPIIDIQVSVADVEAESDYLPDLVNAGYRLRVREIGHRLVRTSALDVHVHICSSASDWEQRHLLFRDWISHDETDRAAYAALKQELAARNWTDMNAYAAAKGPLISEILARAEAWQRIDRSDPQTYS